MSQEIEIEYKVLLSKENFELLANEMPFPKETVEQINYYFETKTFDLKKHYSALRIRKKNNGYILTLKEPYGEHILETHDPLTEEEFYNWINGNSTAKSNVSKQLKKLGVAEKELIYFGSLKTERKSFVNDGIEYVLDKSIYNGITDYELEIEAISAEKGLTVFKNLLQQFNIPQKDSITKIERFFLSSKTEFHSE